MHPIQKEYTWGNKTLSVQSRIDYWLIVKEISNGVHSPLCDHEDIHICIPLTQVSNHFKPSY